MKQIIFTLVCLIVRNTEGGGQISDGLKSAFSSGSGNKSDAIIQLPSITDKVMSHPMLSTLMGKDRGNFITGMLKQMTQVSQAPFMAAIESMGLKDSATPFWISNDIHMKDVEYEHIQKLSSLPGIFTIRKPETVSINPLAVVPIPAELFNETKRALVGASSGQWGVNRIQAPYVWDKGYTGQGIVVANIDTGVKGDHEALKSNYGGKWYDPYYGYSSPTDAQGHGTHTMGIICGTKYGIGVAPGAKWIACRGLSNTGSGTEANIKKCGQWIQEQQPHVVSNSWGGDQGKSWFNDVVTAWRKSGIVPIFSIGNSGSDCNTANSPGDQPNLISVGSTTNDDSMSDFSSRGYSVQGKMKPEISSPGSDIVSSYIRSTTSYVYLSGTSMSCPNVAGAAALMLSKDKSLTIQQITQQLLTTADQPQPTADDLSCGTSSSSSDYPNNAYGYGITNVRKAMGL